MEHAQRDCKRHNINSVVSLNPYFNGTCSKRMEKMNVTSKVITVLILILMEHAQRETNPYLLIKSYKKKS